MRYEWRIRWCTQWEAIPTECKTGSYANAYTYCELWFGRQVAPPTSSLFSLDPNASMVLPSVDARQRLLKQARDVEHAGGGRPLALLRPRDCRVDQRPLEGVVAEEAQVEGRLVLHRLPARRMGCSVAYDSETAAGRAPNYRNILPQLSVSKGVTPGVPSAHSFTSDQGLCARRHLSVFSTRVRAWVWWRSRARRHRMRTVAERAWGSSGSTRPGSSFTL